MFGEMKEGESWEEYNERRVKSEKFCKKVAP